MEIPTLCIVVPCFNEQSVIEITIEKLNGCLTELKNKQAISDKSLLLFVDDGSTDNTWGKIQEIKNRKIIPIKGIKFTRNYGHQNALLAGLFKAKNLADIVVTIDADLQQDEQVISTFVEEYKKGNEIVYGVRSSRISDGIFKKFSSLLFYKLMSLMGVNIITNHADFRLTSSKVIEVLEQHQEFNLFLRGIFPTFGFKSSEVQHEVKKREFGKSKYTFIKMLSFAFTGITSFTIFPVRLISILGVVFFFFSMVMAGYAFYAYIFEDTIIGWASTVLPIYFIGGIQLLSIGIIGEYLGKIYMETKKRPRFIIEKEV